MSAVNCPATEDVEVSGISTLIIDEQLETELINDRIVKKDIILPGEYHYNLTLGVYGGFKVALP
ncbi:MAG: hypothetical protein SPI30_03150 [Prevotella sp.]|nr:hypothetical protein [Prevotella sp.]